MPETTIFDSSVAGSHFDGTKTVGQLGFTDTNSVSSISGGNLLIAAPAANNGLVAAGTGIAIGHALYPKVTAAFTLTAGTRAAFLFRRQANGSALIFIADNPGQIFIWDGANLTTANLSGPAPTITGPSTMSVDMERPAGGTGLDVTVTVVSNSVTTVQTAAGVTAGPQVAGDIVISATGGGTATYSSIQVQSADAAAVATSGSLILFDGDSITYGTATSNPPATGHPALVAAALNSQTPGRWTAINNGIPGKALSAINTDFATISVPLLAGNYTDKIYILAGGDNDVSQGRTTAQIEADISAIVSKARAAGATKVYSCAMAYANGTAKGVILSAMDTYIRAGSTGADRPIDYPADSRLATQTNTTYYNTDTLHPTDAGQQAMAQDTVSVINLDFPAPSGTADPYQSNTATAAGTLVDYKPNTPSPFVVSGLGTFNLPTAVLTVGVPTDLPGGRYVWLRRAAGSNASYVILGTTTGVDINTPPINTFTDSTCKNGVHYDYGVYALPSGDF